MILASAQTKPNRGDIFKNLTDHYQFIEVASQYGTNLIAFPEMSVTGYERIDAKPLSFLPDDSRLDKLRRMACDKKIIIIVGAPIILQSDLYIGSFIIKTDGSISIYTKQYLHPGEEEFFNSSFDYNPIIELEYERISLAICADIDNPEHPKNANKAKSTIYIPSIFFTPKGIPEAYQLLGNYAKKYSMNILMSNFTGQSWGIDAGGGSAFWNKDGEIISKMNSSDSGLLVVEKKDDSWSGQAIYVE
jgi:predicted amidohydrolase